MFSFRNFRVNFYPSGILSWILHTLVVSISSEGSSGTFNSLISVSFIDAMIAEIISGSSPYSAARF